MQDNIKDFLIAIFNTKKQYNIAFPCQIYCYNSTGGFLASANVNYYVYSITVSGNQIQVVLYTPNSGNTGYPCAYYGFIYPVDRVCHTNYILGLPVPTFNPINMQYTLIIIQLTVQ